VIKDTKENKIFVYDTSRGFYRFIKLNYEKEYSIDLCNKKNQFEDFAPNLPKYNHCFFIINSKDDVLNLLKLFSKTSKIFLAVMVRELENEFDNFENFIKLNLNLSKKDLTNFLNKYLILCNRVESLQQINI
jgi:hypothetical protein